MIMRKFLKYTSRARFFKSKVKEMNYFFEAGTGYNPAKLRHEHETRLKNAMPDVYF